MHNEYWLNQRHLARTYETLIEPFDNQRVSKIKYFPYRICEDEVTNMSTLLTRKFEKGFTLGLDFKRLLLPDLAQDSSEDSYDPNDIEFDEDENHFSFNGVFL